MPSKQPSFWDVSGKEAPKEKPPTLRQFIKEQPIDVYPILCRIVVVWFPGNWDNYSLETDKCRVSIAPNHPLYNVLERSGVKVFSECENAVLLEIIDREGTIRFVESNVYGKYSRIGNAGFRFDETEGAN
jgi:hypothetical protein